MRRWLGLVSIVAIGAGLFILGTARLPASSTIGPPADHHAPLPSSGEWVVPGLPVPPGRSVATVVGQLTPATGPAVVIAVNSASPTAAPDNGNAATPGRE